MCILYVCECAAAAAARENSLSLLCSQRCIARAREREAVCAIVGMRFEGDARAYIHTRFGISYAVDVPFGRASRNKEREDISLLYVYTRDEAKSDLVSELLASLVRGVCIYISKVPAFSRSLFCNTRGLAEFRYSDVY